MIKKRVGTSPTPLQYRPECSHGGFVTIVHNPDRGHLTEIPPKLLVWSRSGSRSLATTRGKTQKIVDSTWKGWKVMPSTPDDEKIKSINQQLLLLFISHSNFFNISVRWSNFSMILLSRIARNPLRETIVTAERTMAMTYLGETFMVSEIKELVVCFVIQSREEYGWFNRSNFSDLALIIVTEFEFYHCSICSLLI